MLRSLAVLFAVRTCVSVTKPSVPANAAIDSTVKFLVASAGVPFTSVPITLSPTKGGAVIPYVLILAIAILVVLLF